MNLLREYVRELLTEKMEGWDYLSPPRDFKDKTGIDMIHDYRLPPEHTSPEALQDHIEGSEPKDPQEATQFYSSIVNDLVKLNPELAPIVGTGAPGESMLLPDQQLSDVYPWHLKDIVMGVASEMPVADIKYYLEDRTSEAQTISQKFIDQTGVRPEWIISPETAAKHLELRERRLREYIRELLTEAAQAPADLPARIVVHIFEDGNSTRITYAKPTEEEGAPRLYGRSKMPSGIVEIFRPGSIEDDGPCGGAWQIGLSSATPGWGPLLYDVAMEWATLEGGGLISDREVVSGDARKVWDYYMANRGDVTGIQMDDLKNSLTPEDEDNCNQHAAGSTSVAAFGAENAEKQGWVDSPLSKRWTKPPTTIEALRKLKKLVEA